MTCTCITHRQEIVCPKYWDCREARIEAQKEKEKNRMVITLDAVALASDLTHVVIEEKFGLLFKDKYNEEQLKIIEKKRIEVYEYYFKMITNKSLAL